MQKMMECSSDSDGGGDGDGSEVKMGNPMLQAGMLSIHTTRCLNSSHNIYKQYAFLQFREVSFSTLSPGLTLIHWRASAI